jgi:hypothetical protein
MEDKIIHAHFSNDTRIIQLGELKISPKYYSLRLLIRKLEREGKYWQRMFGRCILYLHQSTVAELEIWDDAWSVDLAKNPPILLEISNFVKRSNGVTYCKEIPSELYFEIDKSVRYIDYRSRTYEVPIARDMKTALPS